MRSSAFIPVALLVLLISCTASAQRHELVADDASEIPVTRGATVRAFTIKSDFVKETRRVFVALPPSYSKSASTRRYPVTVVLDGEDNLPSAIAVASELSRNGQIPEMIIVAIPNTNRLRDLTPPGISVSGSSSNEGGDQFLDFIEQELIPAVGRNFRGGEPRTLVGHSSGGIITTYAAATRSFFRTYVAIDTPTHLEDNWLPKKLIVRAEAPKIPIRYVSLEARFGWTDSSWARLTKAAPANWQLTRTKLPHESHESMGMLSMYLGLREVFRDYSSLVAPVAPTTSILPAYAKVGEALGTTVIPPRRLLRNVTEDLMMEGRGAQARAAYNMLVAGYGAPQDSTELLRQLAETEKRPPPTETVEGLLATPFASPAEIKPFIGDWVGDIWMSDDEVRNGKTTLRISVVDGKVKGQTIDKFPDGQTLIMDWQHIRVTPAGLTWGYMNGMRPRGVLLYEGVLKGDTLKGDSRFGGINFVRPDGTSPAVIHFQFKRVGK